MNLVSSGVGFSRSIQRKRFVSESNVGMRKRSRFMLCNFPCVVNANERIMRVDGETELTEWNRIFWPDDRRRRCVRGNGKALSIVGRKSGDRFTARVVITPRHDVSSQPIEFLLMSKERCRNYVKRRFASLRSVVLRERRNCLLALLS